MKIIVKNISKKYNPLVPGKKKHILEYSGRPNNITSILYNFKSLIKQVYHKECIKKFNKKIDQNICFTSDLKQR